MNGGNLTVEVGQGDTDPIDSNGNVMVTGGTIKMTGQTGFDFDGTATYTGGDISISTVKNKRKLSTLCLEAVDQMEVLKGRSSPWRTRIKRISFSKEKGEFCV